MTKLRIEKTIKHIREGRYAADVEVELRYGETPWDPTIGPNDIEKLDRVRLSLRRGDIQSAAKEAKVFELLPLAGNKGAGRRQVNMIETRKREHSRKPDEQYAVIEACSRGPYLELFARGTWPG